MYCCLHFESTSDILTDLYNLFSHYSVHNDNFQQKHDFFYTSKTRMSEVVSVQICELQDETYISVPCYIVELVYENEFDHKKFQLLNIPFPLCGLFFVLCITYVISSMGCSEVVLPTFISGSPLIVLTVHSK